MRSFLALGLILSLSACEDRDDWWERQFALDDAIGPVWDVAIASQWYELENGQWPTSIDRVADLDEALGQVIRQPPEPVPIPDASAFKSVRFEAVGDSLLRVHFDLDSFAVPPRGEVEIQDEDGPPRAYSPPGTTVSRSRGVIEIPAYREEKLSSLETRVSLAEATVRSEAGTTYEFENERRDLGPVIFLKPLGSAAPAKPQNPPLQADSTL